MRPSEIVRLVNVGRPEAPYGVRRLARCISIEDLARVARRRVPAAAMAYLDGGGEDEVTLRRNRQAFEAVRLVPHVLRDVSEVDLSTTLLGAATSAPIALAPVGAPRLFHRAAEPAGARAAARAGLPFAISTLASTSLEDVAAAGDGALWFALYVWGDRGVARELVARAADAGYRALVVTADVTVRSKRERELHAGVTLPTPRLRPGAVLEGARHPSWWWHFLTGEAPTFPNIPGGTGAIEDLFDGTVGWGDLEWLRAAWAGPLVLKGVLDPDDARRAVDAGVDAVVVSNHGGRQLDQVPASIEALPAVVDAVGDRVEVLLDSGVRRGTDILAALRLGARGVLVGRAWLYGLAAAGEAGVAHAIDILVHELHTAMALSGLQSVRSLASTR